MAQAPKTKLRIGIRDIANATGVSLMTVSLALRNNPRISEKTRARIRAAADELGYRPDPEISRLMTRLHHSRHADDAPPMAILDLSNPQDGGENYYGARVRTGAVKRAESLGYSPSSFDLKDYGGDVRRLIKVVHYRGIRGVLLLPPTKPQVLPTDIDWSGFAVIAATYALTPLQFHCVVPHQYIDICRLIELLQSRGFQRIGAILETGYEARTHHHFTAAFLLHGHGERILRMNAPWNMTAKDVLPWIQSAKPDVILSPFCSALLNATGSDASRLPKLVNLGMTTEPIGPYWDEQPEDIGAEAASLLAGMMQHNEFGVPRSPRTSMIHGSFHDGEPVRRPDKAAKAKPRATKAGETA